MAFSQASRPCGTAVIRYLSDRTSGTICCFSDSLATMSSCSIPEHQECRDLQHKPLRPLEPNHKHAKTAFESSGSPRILSLAISPAVSYARAQTKPALMAHRRFVVLAAWAQDFGIWGSRSRYNEIAAIVFPATPMLS